MESNILIIGSSGHAKVVIDVAERQGKYRIAGLIDSYRIPGETTAGYPVVGDLEDLPVLIEQLHISGLFIAVGQNFFREKIVNQIDALNLHVPFVSLIHPDSTIASTAKIGDGCLVCAGVILAPDVVLGNHVIINHNSSVDHDTVVSDFASFAPRAVCGGTCVIGRNTAICIGAILSHKIKVGENSVVGAGAVVLNSQGNNGVIFGCPAKFVRFRKTDDPYL